MSKVSLLTESVNQLLCEQAYKRYDLEEKVTNEASNIFTHILKILRYGESRDRNKHLREMTGIIKSLTRLKYKHNGKRPKPEEYFQWMYTELTEGEDFNLDIESLDFQYPDEEITMSASQIQRRLREIYEQLVKDMSDGKFKSLGDYI